MQLFFLHLSRKHMEAETHLILDRKPREHPIPAGPCCLQEEIQCFTLDVPKQGIPLHQTLGQ